MTVMLEGPTVFGMDSEDDGVAEAMAASEMAREGRDLRQRREALQMSLRQFSEKTGLNRTTVASVEAGDARRVSRDAVRAALAGLEHEMGMDLPAAEDAPNDLDLVEFVVTGPSADWRVVVKGPVRDREELEQSVLRLISGMQQTQEKQQE